MCHCVVGVRERKREKVNVRVCVCATLTCLFKNPLVFPLVGGEGGERESHTQRGRLIESEIDKDKAILTPRDMVYEEKKKERKRRVFSHENKASLSLFSSLWDRKEKGENKDILHFL